MMRIAIVLFLCFITVNAQAAGSYIFEKPLLPNPSDGARMYIYDPITKTDRNIEWKALKDALPAGPTGPAGPVGLNFRGEWSPDTTYSYRDAITFNGSSYICLNPEGC